MSATNSSPSSSVSPRTTVVVVVGASVDAVVAEVDGVAVVDEANDAVVDAEAPVVVAVA